MVVMRTGFPQCYAKTQDWSLEYLSVKKPTRTWILKWLTGCSETYCVLIYNSAWNCFWRGISRGKLHFWWWQAIYSITKENKNALLHLNNKQNQINETMEHLRCMSGATRLFTSPLVSWCNDHTLTPHRSRAGWIVRQLIGVCGLISLVTERAVVECSSSPKFLFRHSPDITSCISAVRWSSLEEARATCSCSEVAHLITRSACSLPFRKQSGNNNGQTINSN